MSVESPAEGQARCQVRCDSTHGERRATNCPSERGELQHTDTGMQKFGGTNVNAVQTQAGKGDENARDRTSRRERAEGRTLLRPDVGCGLVGVLFLSLLSPPLCFFSRVIEIV